MRVQSPFDFFIGDIYNAMEAHAPFDCIIKVNLPPGFRPAKVSFMVNLLSDDRFLCPICLTEGKDEYITLISISDHIARHRLEKKRLGVAKKL